MKSKQSWLISGVLILLIIIFGIVLSESETTDFETNTAEHVFFAEWHSYLGYALYEEEGCIQLPFLDEHTNYKHFTGRIKEVYLNITSDHSSTLALDDYKIPIKLTGFFYSEGVKITEGKYSVRRLSIPFHIKSVGKVKFNELTLVLSNGKRYTWDIGQWVIEVKKIPSQDDFEQGRSSFVVNPVPKYGFEIINKSSNLLQCDQLVYGDDILDELHMTCECDSRKIEAGYSEVVSYSAIEYETSESRLYCIKPYLSYFIGDEKKIATLDASDLSGILMESDIEQIIKNAGK